MTFGYEKLEVWKESFELAFIVHHLTKQFPPEEKYVYVEQMRRATLSIPSNIAEGKGRMSDRELRRFCLIANGSAMELQTQLRLAKRLHFAPIHTFVPAEQKLELVLRLLNRFMRQLCPKKPNAKCEKPNARISSR
jgi:four helix bundle protein